MAHLMDETRIDDLEAIAMPYDAIPSDGVIRAGAGACSKCGCQQFERWGANADQCGKQLVRAQLVGSLVIVERAAADSSGRSPRRTAWR